MAETTETILLNIEIEKGSNEAEIDSLTKKLTELQQATASLQKQNNELIKTGQQNSEQYIENTRQIEINKQKITEASASRKGLVQTLLAEEKSIKALRVENAELIKQRDKINTLTISGQKQIAAINERIDENNKLIKENVSAQEKQTLNIGNYSSAINGLIPGMGAIIGLFTGAGKALRQLTMQALAFLATPLGAVIAAIGVALAAVQAYFKSSEEAQNKWNKVVAIGSAILEQFMNVLEDLGGAIVAAFENPKQAAIDFMEFLQNQFINRLTGMLELIPQLGLAVEQLFKGNFAEAGKIALDAVGKVALGIENATDKISDFINETAALVEQGIALGTKLADLQAQIDKDERKLIVDRQKLNLEVQKKREEALKFEGEERKKILLEAIALEQQLAVEETKLANLRLTQAETLLKTNGDDKEAKKAVAEAQAAVFAAETTAFQNTIKFKKEIAAIDEATVKEQNALLAEADAMIQKAHEDEMKRIEVEKTARLELAEIKLEEEIKRAETIQERVEKEIELETFRSMALLDNLALTEAEKQVILEKSQAKINDIIVKGTEERVKKEAAAEKKLHDEKTRQRQENMQGAVAVADAAIELAGQVFGRNKAIGIAQTVMNTVLGISRAISDYPFPYSVIVAALVGAIGTAQTARIAGLQFARGGMIRAFANGGISNSGGMLRGPLHRDGGIPFSVGGRVGFEAEGGEAIINRRSTKMFHKELSAINQAGGGVAFARGGVFQTGAIVGSQTNAASVQAQSLSSVQNSILTAMANMPPIVVSVTDINERATEISDLTQKANVV